MMELAGRPLPALNIMGNTIIQNAEISKILGAGVPQSYIDANPQFRNGSWIDPQDTGKYISGWKASAPAQTPTAGGIPSLGQLAGQTYTFDPNQYLPGIQATASSIYDPQQAQIDALAKLGASQTEQAKITTKAEFAKELEARIERINARGAFFGGGAINQENDVLSRQTGALNNIDFAGQAQQAGFLAQQAGLSAEQAQYIQDKLSGAENSAYSRFNDQRNFLLGLTQEQRRIFEDDRDFNENVRQFGLNYALDKKAAKDKGKDNGNSGTYSQFTADGKVYTINNATGQITATGVSNSEGGADREA